MNVTMDIPVILNRVNIDDVYEGDFKERRSMVWTLDFTLKGYLYGPVKSSKIIKFANTEFFVVKDFASANSSDPVASFVQVQPGLTVDGEPTSNAALSIPVADIVATDDYGYVTFVTERDYGQ
jgi:hypothetical protein